MIERSPYARAVLSAFGGRTICAECGATGETYYRQCRRNDGGCEGFATVEPVIKVRERNRDAAENRNDTL